jgi:F-type H+-transporting ATPase subunit delta
MNESQISVRYAKALFQSASERKILDQVFMDMELIAETCKLQDFRNMLILPSLQPTQKYRVVEAVLKDYTSDISMALVNLVIQNKRERYLPGIARYFRDLYRKAKGIRTASLVTAQPVDDQALGNIKKLIAKAYQSDVELSTLVDEDVIGGFVLTVEDRQYDASVATSLRKIKKELLQTNAVKK